MSNINVKEIGAKGAYTPYGGCLEFMTCKEHQVFIYGSTGSGKTTAGCHKMMLLCTKYPGVKFLFTRKSYRALVKSGVETFERVLREHGWRISNKPGPNTVQKMGEAEPREYRFPHAKRVDENGRVYEGVSRVVLSSIDRVYDEMGSEYDYIYVNQPEEAEEDDWQFLATRANGRRGIAPYPQLFGDPNPKHEKHWIKLGGYEIINGNQVGDGTRWRLIKSKYTDNPMIWDQKLNCPTKSGEEQLTRLKQSLNSVMTARLIEGEWCSFEGIVFGEVWDKTRHVRPASEFDITDRWERYWGIDFGFTDPFVCLMFAKHPDKNLYVCYRTIYRTNRTINEHVETIKNATLGEPKPRLIVADRNPESISILTQALGYNVISAKKGAGSLKTGINVLTDMLKNDELVFLQDSLFEEDPVLRDDKRPVGFEEEVDNYRWDTDKLGEVPIGGDEHAIDAARYLFTHIKANQRVVPFIWS
jgi:phage terminase large subunit